jgi:molecular chaperone DnaJ
MEIDFMESIKGSTKSIKFEKKGTCPTCNGSKSKPGTSPARCSACGGKGTVNFR